MPEAGMGRKTREKKRGVIVEKTKDEKERTLYRTGGNEGKVPSAKRPRLLKRGDELSKSRVQGPGRNSISIKKTTKTGKERGKRDDGNVPKKNACAAQETAKTSQLERRSKVITGRVTIASTYQNTSR